MAVESNILSTSSHERDESDAPPQRSDTFSVSELQTIIAEVTVNGFGPPTEGQEMGGLGMSNSTPPRPMNPMSPGQTSQSGMMTPQIQSIASRPFTNNGPTQHSASLANGITPNRLASLLGGGHSSAPAPFSGPTSTSQNPAPTSALDPGSSPSPASILVGIVGNSSMSDSMPGLPHGIMNGIEVPGHDSSDTNISQTSHADLSDVERDFGLWFNPNNQEGHSPTPAPPNGPPSSSQNITPNSRPNTDGPSPLLPLSMSDPSTAAVLGNNSMSGSISGLPNRRGGLRPSTVVAGRNSSINPIVSGMGTDMFLGSEFMNEIGSPELDTNLFQTSGGDLNFERDFGQWFNPNDQTLEDLLDPME
ncbi:hypothetical protein EV361DRAFT_895352 [Lentinula raphanica]|uniref:Uncharacterized protein n=1 Tax=Lentinula raphanica TaxID=153919 RepID=A0AA38NY77_9AGAR|nr:hypothetical protein F5878DRAFT_634210 [Lentinula raphanica]KAJ3974268.1 hypothetical protein EV361DRAFT_895352 [Lentinula raphanica]